MKKYSQNNEQNIILQHFRHRKGTFLDLGAYDGINLSNVRALAELGWSGVMVEASPTVFEQLKKNYEDFPDVELHNCAVGAMTGILDFHDNHNAVGTLHKGETERWKGSQQFKTIEVPCMEINEFLDLCEHKTFDFISCDIEGEDLNVIGRMDFNALKTKMICVEWNGKDKFLYDKILLTFGFRLIHKNGENLIYRR
jgi:FkbM family methyltransferase